MKRLTRDEFWQLPKGVIFCDEDPNQRVDRKRAIYRQGVYPENLKLKDNTGYTEDGIPCCHYETTLIPEGEYIPELEEVEGTTKHDYELDLTSYRGNDMKGDPDAIYIVFENEDLQKLKFVIENAIEVNRNSG